MNRIRACLKNRNGRKLLIPFLTVGYPDFNASLELVKVATDSGVDMVELGMPFSDPLADGPEIQYSSQVALSNGTSLKRIIGGIEQLRRACNLPLIAMGYYNPILSYGQNAFFRDASAAGLDGLIIPDLPIDEAEEFRSAAVKERLSPVFLVAPTSSPERARKIDRMCTDFVYAVTVTGITGSERKFGKNTTDYLARLKKDLKKPFVAGFGVSSAKSAKKLTQFADGVVIGSALIRLVRSARNRRAGMNDVGKFLSSIRKALG